ncbi:MAG: heat-inducible transcription repressor HrcA [Oscillospiraceae bacterium]|nr:heat-inducible transcription repressor HrcA [Oscillospiraceae bacterium]
MVGLRDGVDKRRVDLRAIVEQYVESAEPVGSKSIAADRDIALSSATVRNEMSELEALGLLEQPHTSAGRVPTSLGYRIYVNELMLRHRLSVEETEQINSALKSRVQQLDRMLSVAGRLTAQLTNYPAFALTSAQTDVTITRFDIIYVDANTFIIVVMLGNNTVRNKLVHLPFSVEQGQLTKLSALFNASFTSITEAQITSALISATERAAGDTQGLTAIIAGFTIETLMSFRTQESFVTGSAHIFSHPEYKDVTKAQRLLSYLSDSETILSLPAPDGEGDMKITIGAENLAEELRDSSVVVARYDAGDDMQGLIGVVGPTRMDYSKVAARLSYIAKGLGYIFSGGEPLAGLAEAPPGTEITLEEMK